MRKLSLSEISSGDELAVDVKIQSEHPGTLYRLRLETGHELTRTDLKRLKKLGHEYVFVKDSATEDLDHYIYDRDLAAAEEKVSRSMKNITDNLEQGNFESVDSRAAAESINGLISRLRDSEAMMAFTSLKSHDDYTAKHSLDVSRLTLSFVLSQEEKFLEIVRSNTAASSSYVIKYWLEDLGLGALLHDIGKWKIPRSLLTKSEKLDQAEWEAIKKHPSYGHNLLKKLRRKNIIRPTVCQAALTHHEKYGGNGYPRGKKGNNIHLHGRITSLCDVYSALTSNRAYKVAMSPNRALETMDSMMKEEAHFDPDIYRLFKKFITPFPIGQEVVLDNGTKGVVCEITDNPEKPYVRVLYKGNERLASPKEIRANTKDGPGIIN